MKHIDADIPYLNGCQGCLHLTTETDGLCPHCRAHVETPSDSQVVDDFQLYLTWLLLKNPNNRKM